MVQLYGKAARFEDFKQPIQLMVGITETYSAYKL